MLVPAIIPFLFARNKMYEEEATTARLGIILNFICIDEYCVILNMSCR